MGDTNWAPFDTSTAAAGCAAVRCGRAQIRRAIGRLCPGSVPLTQLPQGCWGGWRVRPLELSAEQRAEQHATPPPLPPAPLPLSPWQPDPRPQENAGIRGKKRA